MGKEWEGLLNLLNVDNTDDDGFTLIVSVLSHSWINGTFYQFGNR